MPIPTYRITTYIKIPRGQTGLTQLASKRLNVAQALDWLLSDLDADATTVSHDGDMTTIEIDWRQLAAAHNVTPVEAGRRV
jgi:hypothetical protein